MVTLVSVMPLASLPSVLPGAGGDQQHIQQLLGTDRFGLGDGVPDFVAADALDLLAEIRGLAKAGVGFIGVGERMGMTCQSGWAATASICSIT